MFWKQFVAGKSSMNYRVVDEGPDVENGTLNTRVTDLFLWIHNLVTVGRGTWLIGVFLVEVFVLADFMFSKLTIWSIIAGTTAETQQTQDDCRAPIIALAVLLGVAVIIAVILAIVLIRKGRFVLYSVVYSGLMHNSSPSYCAIFHR